MMKSHPLLWFGVGIIFILFIHFFVSQFDRVDEKLNSASTNYKNGEEADTIATRKDSFNEALAIYKDLDKEYAPTFGNGKLDYNIANSYFQLEEYPQAIVHYLRALQLSPRDENIKANLTIAQSKLGIAPQIDTSASRKIFFFSLYIINT